MPDQDSTDYLAGVRDAEFKTLQAQVEKLERHMHERFNEQHKDLELLKRVMWIGGGGLVATQAIIQLLIPFWQASHHV